MIFRLLLISFSILLFSSPAQAQFIAKQSYETYAVEADLIIRGKIVGARKMTVYRDGSDKPCGVYMDIQVLESYRGEAQNLLLYNTHSDIYFEDADTEYFIFAFKNKFYNTDMGEREFILCEGLNSTSKNLQPFEYLSDSQVQRVFPIAKDNAGREWMQIMQRRSASSLPESIAKRLATGGRPNVMEEMPLDQFLAAFELNK